jgi:uncharacterized iron-regulated membrane protein
MLRQTVFWIHLTCGLAVGVVVLIMSATGVLLTYQKQLTEWADREHWGPHEKPGVTARVAGLTAAAEAHGDGAAARSLIVWSAPDAPVAVALEGGRTVYLDPSTAEVRGEGSETVRWFFRAVVGWHRWFDVEGEGRSVARRVTGWSNVVFLFLVLSGLYLWFPRRWAWQHLRPILVLNPRARGKARDFNWHHVFGFWLAVPLAVVVASATVISFPWASDLAYRVMGEEPPQRRAPGAVPTRPEDEGGRAETRGNHPEPALDALLASARQRLPEWRTIGVGLPRGAADEVSFQIDQGWGGAPQKRFTLTYDVATGAETAFTGFSEGTPGRRLRTFLRFAHTGEYYGLPGQTVAGLASLAGVVLVWSGFALAWRRLARALRA